MNSLSLRKRKWILKSFNNEDISFFKENFSLDEITSKLLSISNQKPNFSIAINRGQRKESNLFRFFYELYCLIIRVFYLLTNGVTVVSEVGSDTKSNNKYLDSICACEYEQICEKIIYLIENDNERKEIGMKGLDTIKKFPQSLFTKEILDNKI